MQWKRFCRRIHPFGDRHKHLQAACASSRWLRKCQVRGRACIQRTGLHPHSLLREWLRRCHRDRRSRILCDRRRRLRLLQLLQNNLLNSIMTTTTHQHRHWLDREHNQIRHCICLWNLDSHLPEGNITLCFNFRSSTLSFMNPLLCKYVS
ncbi:hypothetical protein K449DRAFT_421421 [Hypoxylon sp. EC38]|nr:hypothetical protein K449DRAFT_421421 [Hypoxylon sp. EC38]